MQHNSSSQTLWKFLPLWVIWGKQFKYKSTKNLKQNTKLTSMKLLEWVKSRHQATWWSDVDFLDVLERQYFDSWDINNLAIASEIRIFEDYIEVSGIKITNLIYL